MKPSVLVACGLCLFSAGAGLGWVAAPRPDENAASQPQAVAEPAQPRRRTTEQENPKLAEMKRLAADPARLEQEIEGLSETELPMLIDQMSARAGIEGLDWDQRSNITQLVKRLYDTSPETALTWVHGITHDGNRKFYFEAILETATSKDAQQALELAERFRRDTGDMISPPRELCKAMAGQGADSLLRALKLSIGEPKGVSGSTVDFPEDFDFDRMAEGLAETASRMTKGEQFSYMPSNFIESWSRRDPQAAFEWALAADTNQRTSAIPFIGGLSGFFEGYSKIQEPADYGRFAAQATMAGELTEQSWRNAFSALSSNPDSVAIDAFFAEATASRDSGEIIRGLLDISRNFSGGSYDKLRNRMLHRLPEDQRAAYLRDAPESVRSRLTPDATD